VQYNAALAALQQFFSIFSCPPFILLKQLVAIKILPVATAIQENPRRMQRKNQPKT
jgi:hypothetical protein